MLNLVLIALLARCHWLSQVFHVVAGSYCVQSILTFAGLKWAYRLSKAACIFYLKTMKQLDLSVLICDTCWCVLPAWWSVLAVDLAVVREECCCLSAVTCGWGSLHLSFSSFLVFWGILLVLFFLRQDLFLYPRLSPNMSPILALDSDQSISPAAIS